MLKILEVKMVKRTTFGPLVGVQVPFFVAGAFVKLSSMRGFLSSFKSDGRTDR
jgi:hypothetical protein